MVLSLMLLGIWSQGVAWGQNSAAPPVSLTPPNASPPHASAKSAKPKREPASPGASRREPSPPVIGSVPAPNPAADYDGFSASTDDNDAPSQVTPPARSRAANGSGLDAQSLVDQEDEALKRKLTICQKCK